MNTVWGLLKELAFGSRASKLDDEKFNALVDIMLQAQAAVEIHDNENLFVPGSIIAMYGTMSEIPEKGEEAKVTVRSAYIDPAHAFLRYFEMNERMFSDHVIPAYHDSFKGCIDSKTKAENLGKNRECNLLDLLGFVARVSGLFVVFPVHPCFHLIKQSKNMTLA